MVQPKSPSRLKRRSSVAFAADRNGGSENAREEVVDEEAERRARNLQRKQAQAAVQLDSPAVTNEKTSRRSVSGISGLTATQLADHYNSCIKLSAENKISTKNAFNLQLIDYMATMIKKKESNLNNFQVAAGTLDASTKIYACRVDAVYGETMKMATGLGNTQKPDDTVAEQDDDGMVQDEDGNKAAKKVRRKIKKSDAVEKNLKNINCGKFDLAFDVDPLFKKTSSQLDGATGGNQFVYTLAIRDESQDLMLDPDKEVAMSNDNRTREAASDDFTIEIPRLSCLEENQICPSFSQFSFTTWSLEADGNDDEYNKLNQSISASQEERQKAQEEDEHAFDAFAVPEPVDDGDHHDAGFEPDYDDDISEFSERAVGQHAIQGLAAKGFTTNLPMTTSDMLSVLTSTPLEYSYFDQGKLGAWAGPKHWKFKPMKPILTEEVVKGKKKKEISSIQFDEFDDEESLLTKMDTIFKDPKKTITLTEKTMKSWNRDKNTLPEDHHYSGHELVRLKVCDQIVVVSRKSQAETEVDDVEDYDYNNAADAADYCPDVEDDDYGGDPDQAEDNIDNSFDGDMMTARFDGDYADGMVDAPKMVDKNALQIGYAKTAKKVDMKRIKNVTWEILTHSVNDEKENVGASPDKVTKETNYPKKTGKVEEMNFSEVFHELKLPAKLPSKMTEGLTVPLALLALLHLCNEQGLELEQDTGLQDFKIKQGKV